MSLMTNYIFSKNATEISYNFWLESSDWSSVGMTDEAIFILFIESFGATNVVVTNFSLVNDGALKCNISCDDLTLMEFGGFSITSVVAIGDISTAGISSLNFGGNLIENFNPTVLPSILLELILDGNLITTSSWNTNTGYINDLPDNGDLYTTGNTDSIAGTVSETLFLAKGWTITS